MPEIDGGIGAQSMAQEMQKAGMNQQSASNTTKKTGVSGKADQSTVSQKNPANPSQDTPKGQPENSSSSAQESTRLNDEAQEPAAPKGPGKQAPGETRDPTRDPGAFVYGPASPPDATLNNMPAPETSGPADMSGGMNPGNAAYNSPAPSMPGGTPVNQGQMYGAGMQGTLLNTAI